jgi:hypothetical protein
MCQSCIPSCAAIQLSARSEKKLICCPVSNAQYHQSVAGMFRSSKQVGKKSCIEPVRILRAAEKCERVLNVFENLESCSGGVED